MSDLGEEILKKQKELEALFAKSEKSLALKILASSPVLGIGKNRVAIETREGAIKLAWREEGYVDNAIEWALWNKAKSELRDLLCPCIALEKGILLQEACVPVSFKSLGEAGIEQMKELSSYGISDVAANLGFFNSNLVCYDYALLAPELLGRVLE